MVLLRSPAALAALRELVKKALAEDATKLVKLRAASRITKARKRKFTYATGVDEYGGRIPQNDQHVAARLAKEDEVLKRVKGERGRGFEILRAFGKGQSKSKRVREGLAKDTWFDDGGYSAFKSPIRAAAYQVGRRPVSSAIAGAGTAAFLGTNVVGPMARGWGEDMGLVEPKGERQRMEAMERGMGTRVEGGMAAMRRERLMAENLARLAQVDPQAYTEMAAGRVLPMGGRVFGGRPRQDILEQVAARIQEGGYPGM